MKKFIKPILYILFFTFVITGSAFAQENFLFSSSGLPYIDFGSFDRNTVSSQQMAQIEMISFGNPYSFSASYSPSFTSLDGERIAIEQMTLEVGGVFSGTTDFARTLPLSRNDRIFYESDDTGTAESLNLVFNVTIPSNSKAGEYTGTVTIIYYENDMEIEEEEIECRLTIVPFIEMKLLTPTGTETTQISFKSLLQIGEVATEEYGIVIDTNLGNKFKVVQQIENVFVNDRNGQQMDSPDFLSYRLFGENLKGELYTTVNTPLSYNEELLYVSNSEGASDAFRIYYYLTHLTSLTYGDYTAFINFQVVPFDASVSFEEQTLKVKFDFQIEKILNVKITPVEGKGRLDFGSILRNAKMVLKTMKVECLSNTGAPYIVSQEFIQPIVNEKGSVFSEEGRFFRTKGGQKGTVLIDDMVTLTTDRVELYRSNEAGVSDTFFVIYGISPGFGNVGGRYSSGIKFMIEEIIK